MPAQLPRKQVPPPRDVGATEGEAPSNGSLGQHRDLGDTNTCRQLQVLPPETDAAEGETPSGGTPGKQLGRGAGLRFTDKDEHMYFWFPLLAGLSELTFDPRADIRYCAVCQGAMMQMRAVHWPCGAVLRTN